MTQARTWYARLTGRIFDILKSSFYTIVVLAVAWTAAYEKMRDLVVRVAINIGTCMAIVGADKSVAMLAVITRINRLSPACIRLSLLVISLSDYL